MRTGGAQRAFRAVKVTSYLVTAGSPSGFDVDLLDLIVGYGRSRVPIT